MEEQVRKSHRQQFSQMRILYLLTMRNIVKTKRTLFLSLVALAPVAIAILFIIMRLADPKPQAGFSFYSDLMSIFQIRGVLLVLTVFYGSTVFTDELDRKTLVYLQGRPISSRAMIFGKYLPAVFLCSILMIISTVICYIFLMKIDGNSKIIDNLNILVRDLGSLLLGGFAYIALMLMLSLLIKKPLIWGLVFTLGWENVIVNIPGPIRKVSILHWIESLFTHRSGQGNVLNLLKDRSSDPLASILVLIALTSIFLIISVIIYRKKEFILND